MPSHHRSLSPSANPTQPFASAVEAWFWYMACHEAKLDGARVVAGRGAIARPCDPADIYLTTTRLLHTGRLQPHHVQVMVRYGRTMLPPDPDRPNHHLAFRHWQEAMARLEKSLIVKGVVG